MGHWTINIFDIKNPIFCAKSTYTNIKIISYQSVNISFCEESQDRQQAYLTPASQIGTISSEPSSEPWRRRVQPSGPDATMQCYFYTRPRHQTSSLFRKFRHKYMSDKQRTSQYGQFKHIHNIQIHKERCNVHNDQFKLIQ